MIEIISYHTALELSARGKRHLMLGNGFSRACRNDLFAYDALFLQAETRLSPRVKKAFEILNTHDFETIMRILNSAADVLPVYTDDEKLISILRDDVDALRDALATAIAGSHPERPHNISSSEFFACRNFLSNFEKIYTLNYDLLLYWTLMQSEINAPFVKHDDGFRHPDSGETDYVAWDAADSTQQNIFYVHGALHIFDAGAELQKYTWANTGIALVDQIRSSLAENKYPLYVSEGTSEEKMRRIMHSAYLSRALRSMVQINGSLFIYGHSLADNDQHILKLIERGKVSKLFVSLFGDSDSKDNKRIIKRAGIMAQERELIHPRKKLDIYFYDATSAAVWG
jgi:hypothetical protein